MERITAVSNECKWYQIETNDKSDLLKPDLVERLGTYGEGEGVK